MARLRNNSLSPSRINCALVYGSLTALVVAIYVLVVGTLDTLLQAGGNLLISPVGTGIVALSFEPLCEQLQRRRRDAPLYGCRSPVRQPRARSR